MQLAASPLILPHAAPSDVMPALWPFASPSLSPSVIFPRMQIGTFNKLFSMSFRLLIKVISTT